MGRRTQESGETLALSRADRVFVGHLPEKVDAAVEANLMQVDERADAIEQVDVQGRTALPSPRRWTPAGRPPRASPRAAPGGSASSAPPAPAPRR